MGAWRGGCQSRVEAELVLLSFLVSCIVAGNPSMLPSMSTRAHRSISFLLLTLTLLSVFPCHPMPSRSRHTRILFTHNFTSIESLIQCNIVVQIDIDTFAFAADRQTKRGPHYIQVSCRGSPASCSTQPPAPALARLIEPYQYQPTNQSTNQRPANDRTNSRTSASTFTKSVSFLTDLTDQVRICRSKR